MATDTLAVKMALSLQTTLTRTDLDTPSPGSLSVVDNMTKSITDTLSEGTIVDTADVVYHDTGTLVNTNRTIDVHTSGTENDPWGTAITMVKIKCLTLHNKNTVAGEYIQLGGIALGTTVFNSSAPAAEFPYHICHPGGILFVWNPSLAGYAVANGVSDKIELDTSGSGASVTYDIVIIGTSA